MKQRNSTSRRSKDFDIHLKDDSKVQIYLKAPTQKEVFQLDKEYRKAMTELLKEGVITTHKLAKVLHKNEEWTNQDDNDMANYAKMIGHHSKQLTETKDDRSESENMQLTEKILEWRAKHLELINRKYLLFDNSAERQADNHRMHTYAQLCCRRSDNDKLFFKDDEAYEDFFHEDKSAASQILTSTYSFEYGTDVDDFTKDWAEINYIRETAEKKLSEKVSEDAPDKEVEVGGPLSEPPEEWPTPTGESTEVVEKEEEDPPEVENTE